MVDFMEFDFVYMFDEKFLKFASLGIEAISAIYPESNIFVYDITTKGPSSKIVELEKQYKNIQYIYWNPDQWLKIDWVENLTMGNYLYGWKKNIQYLSRKCRNKLFGTYKEGWDIDIEAKKHFININCQKPVCCLDALNKTKRSIIFLDADAVLWEKIDELNEDDFDIGVTLRNVDEVKIGIDPGFRTKKVIPYHALNAGFLCFKNNANAREFIGHWIKILQSISHCLSEQTALSEALYRVDKQAFSSYGHTITVPIKEGVSATVKILPCYIYNNTKHFEVPSDKTKIAHFKGYQKKISNFENIKRVVYNKFHN